jgi:hypothetical protein
MKFWKGSLKGKWNSKYICDSQLNCQDTSIASMIMYRKKSDKIIQNLSILTIDATLDEKKNVYILQF